MTTTIKQDARTETIGSRPVHQSVHRHVRDDGNATRGSAMAALLATLAITGAALALTAPAHAADLGGEYRDKPRPLAMVSPPIHSSLGNAPIWDGLYWGGSIGYGWGESEHYYDRGNNHGSATNDLEGGLASLTIGYNYLVSQGLLVGVEGDLGIMDLSADDKVIFDGHVWKSEYGMFWGTIRARAGVLFGDTLLYGTGGWAVAEVNEVGYGDAAGQTAVNEDVRSGWVVGGGLEHAFSPGMTAKVEYLHMDFGSYEGLSENQEAYSFDNSVDLVRAGLNFKF